VRLPNRSPFRQEGSCNRHRWSCSPIEKDHYCACSATTALLDITMRGGEDRSTRKSFTSFTPAGRGWSRETSSATRSPSTCVAGEGHCAAAGQHRDLIWGVRLLSSTHRGSALCIRVHHFDRTPAALTRSLPGSYLRSTLGYGGRARRFGERRGRGSCRTPAAKIWTTTPTKFAWIGRDGDASSADKIRTRTQTWS